MALGAQGAGGKTKRTLSKPGDPAPPGRASLPAWEHHPRRDGAPPARAGSPPRRGRSPMAQAGTARGVRRGPASWTAGQAHHAPGTSGHGLQDRRGARPGLRPDAGCVGGVPHVPGLAQCRGLRLGGAARSRPARVTTGGGWSPRAVCGRQGAAGRGPRSGVQPHPDPVGGGPVRRGGGLPRRGGVGRRGVTSRRSPVPEPAQQGLAGDR